MLCNHCSPHRRSSSSHLDDYQSDDDDDDDAGSEKHRQPEQFSVGQRRSVLKKNADDDEVNFTSEFSFIRNKPLRFNLKDNLLLDFSKELN